MAHVQRRVKMQQKRLSRAAIGIISGGTHISGRETAAPEYTFFDRVGPKLGWLGEAGSSDIVFWGKFASCLLHHNLCHSVEN